MNQDHLFVQRAIELLGRVIPDVLLHLDADGTLLTSYASAISETIELLEPFHGLNIHDCQPLVDWADEKLLNKLRRTIDRTLIGRESAQTTFQLRWPSADSPPRHYDLRALPLLDQTLILIRDTTTESLLHEQLTISERMSSLGTLAAGVAHEINNPLTYIQCNLVLAIDELEAWLDDPARAHTSEPEHLDEIVHSLKVALDGAERVAKITRELKHFSRMDRHATEQIDIRHVVESAIGLASNEIRHRAELHTHYEPHILPVYGDPHQLTQVFINLLINAAQSFDAVDVARPEITVSITQGPQDVQVLVIDNGEGMTTSTLRRIFDPFFTTKAENGTGLGLSVSHRIIHDLGGTLTAESTPGQGTTMSVTLPGHSSLRSVSSEPQLTLEDERATGACIMLIEDEPMIQALICRLLDHHEVHAFDNLHDAIEQLDQLSPRVILCDLMLPGEGGEKLHEHLKTHAPELIERTLYMTGGVFTPGADMFLQYVRPRLLRKPFKNKDLIDQVDEILQDS